MPGAAVTFPSETCSRGGNEIKHSGRVCFVATRALVFKHPFSGITQAMLNRGNGVSYPLVSLPFPSSLPLWLTLRLIISAPRFLGLFWNIAFLMLPHVLSPSVLVCPDPVLFRYTRCPWLGSPGICPTWPGPPHPVCFLAHPPVLQARMEYPTL